MSQRDLAAELRAARITAPVEVRERVRAIAATDPTAREPRFTWRRALVVALPVAAAVAATIVFTRPAHHTSAATLTPPAVERGIAHGAARQKSFGAAGVGTTDSAGVPAASIPVPPSRTRVQRYAATLALRVPTPDGVSTGVQRALRIATALGGHPTSVHATSKSRSAHAELVLRIPRRNVQRAVTQLSQLGTITGEQVDVQDAQAGLDATSRLISRLQRELVKLRAQTNVTQQIAVLTAQIARLQRAQASTIRTASFATVHLTLATPPLKAAVHHTHRGPFHWLGRALVWLGIGAVYALVLGIPLAVLAVALALVVRTVRRRREEALLSET
jgi:hypothetical protein